MSRNPNWDWPVECKVTYLKIKSLKTAYTWWDWKIILKLFSTSALPQSFIHHRSCRGVEHILRAHLYSARGSSGCCHRGIQIGIFHAHTNQNKSLRPLYRIWGRILWMWEYTEKRIEYILKRITHHRHHDPTQKHLLWPQKPQRQHGTGYFKCTDMGTGTKVRGNEVWEESVILTQNKQLILPVFREDSSLEKNMTCQLPYNKTSISFQHKTSEFEPSSPSCRRNYNFL